MATETLRPNAVGDETALDKVGGDANWECVDEVVSDENATYVYTNSTAFVRDLYNLPLSTSSGGINFIKVYTSCTGRGYSGMRAKACIKSNSTITYGSELTPPTPWQTWGMQWDTNPADGEAWEWADIDALQIGVALKAGTDAPWCTQVYVEVDYTFGVVTDSGTLSGTGSLVGNTSPEQVKVRWVGGGGKVSIAPYYVGDNVTLKFIINDDNGPVVPVTANVMIVKPDAKIISPVGINIDENVITYYVPTTVTDIDGLYKAFFVITFSDALIRTHRIDFGIRSKP